MQNAFVIDINKCTGCQACEVACAVENQLEPGTSWRTVSTFNEARHPGIELFHLSLACNHCIDPPCMKHCPALAYSKDEISGAVTIDPDKCIGCKYCTWACPYDAPRFDANQGIVTKCTFCEHRLIDGLKPACVSQCPTGALQISDLNTAPGIADFPGFPDTGAGPAVRFLPLRTEHFYPETTARAATVNPFATQETGSKITVKTEWPLVVFTLLVSSLVGAMAVGGAGMNAFTFAILAAGGMGLSTLHLGRKTRAWRSILNWRNSWLSREIILFSLFAGLSITHLSLGGNLPLLQGLVSVFGFFTLFAIDNVYLVTQTPRLRLHSSQTLLTGALVVGLLGGFYLLFLSAITLKMILYSYRKLVQSKMDSLALVLFVLRICFGALIPMWLWLSQPPNAGISIFLVLSLALGEFIDRCQFYVELVVQSPRRQIAKDLASRLASSHTL